MSSGWIKIYRSLQEHWIWENEKYLKWWLDLLLLANHQDRDILINGELITIKRGQKHTSELWLSNRWNADRKQVRKFLELLKKNDMITITKSRQKGTTYEISNYNDFQGISEEIRTTKGTTIDTTEDTTKEHQMVQRKGHKQELKNLRIKELKKDINNNNSDLNFKDFWEQNGFGMMLPVELEKLLAWVDDFAGNREIVMKALEVTSEQGANKRNYAYVNKILKNWESRGFKTIADVDAAEKQRQIELEQKYNKPFNKYNKPVKQEILPEWFDKEQQEAPKKPEMTEEEKEALEKRVAEIKAKLAAEEEAKA
ncbi:DnaD domain protein [Listeria monocytogenes]|nr:DnaD domain protein [Listeria monocytogenes]EAC9171007.1 DnaD domain protein [Listeria monocytogenes]EAK8912756.1 DnaD domain protein [Listeria monocytogenes]